MFCYCAESRRAARLLTARYDQHLAGTGLSSAQFEVLSVLQAETQVNGRALSDLLAVDPTTLSRNLKALCALKFVHARKSTADGRQKVYALTAKGLRQLEAAKPAWLTAHRVMLDELGAQAAPVRAALQDLAGRLRA